MGLSKAEVKRMITSSSMETLDFLMELIHKHQDDQLTNTLIVIRSDLTDIERMYQRNINDYDEYRRGLNKINLNLLKVIDDLPDQYFNESSEGKSQDNTTFVIADQIRLQISTLIKDILDINIQENQTGNNAYIASSLNHKRHIILSQIARLIESNNISVAGTEYMAIALAYNSILDMSKAEQYYKRAIENIDEYTDSAFGKIFIIRSYADFLYRNNRHSDGAKQYESAILQGQGDTDNIMNGYTYQMKFVNECDMQDYEEAVKSYKKAKDYYLTVANKTAQRYNMEQLENAWNTRHVSPVYSRP